MSQLMFMISVLGLVLFFSVKESTILNKAKYEGFYDGCLRTRTVLGSSDAELCVKLTTQYLEELNEALQKN